MLPFVIVITDQDLDRPAEGRPSGLMSFTIGGQEAGEFTWWRIVVRYWLDIAALNWLSA